MIGVIILLNFIVFFRTLRYSTVIDDNCRRFHEKDVPKNWFIKFYHITRYSGYGGFTTQVDHLITLLLHTTVCIMIYLIFGRSPVSLVTALLFSIHPVNNQTSIWLNGKRYAVITILTLLMWFFKPYGIFFYLLTPMWHYGAMPAIILYALKYNWVIWVGVLLIIAFHKNILEKVGTRWERMPHGELKIARPRKLVILIKMIGYVFLHCLLPRRMSFWHVFMERFGFSDEDNKYWYSFNKDFYIGLGVTSGLAWLIYFNWDNPIGFGLFWWVIFVLPWCQFPIGVTQAISERVYYLPNVGLCYALGYFLTEMPYSEYTITAIFTYYLVKLWFYMPAYKNVDEFYRYALNEFPDQFRARGHLVRRYLEEQRLFYALRDAGLGLKITPKDCTLNLLMVQALMSLGAFGMAKGYLDKAEKCMIPGQETNFKRDIEKFRFIIDDRIKNPNQPPVERIKPGEVFEISPSQICGGR
ncbi:hypothetical protein LCGC14_1771070 [marine sediment metagenome]|uniref:Uncharacterized protein n=1 Tax=marine sediment metagenome TaxID=412755 RepID=A0A0F9JY11_9ZZZZ